MADGSTPWCVGFESGGATGWPATDWMEDIMLRTAGPDVYDQWVSHEIPFNDPAVATAAETFGDVMFGEGYVLGGAEQTPAIAFGDAPTPMFDDPPGCWLHRQASFINAFFPEGTEAGVDYDWFPFPRSTRRACCSRASWRSRSGTPEVVDFLEQVHRRGRPVRDGRRDGVLADLSERRRRTGLLRELDPGRLVGGADRGAPGGHRPVRRVGPDAGEVGSGSFWTGMVEYMQEGPDSLTGVLDDIEASWPTE